jgi:hypothetical protein
MLFKQSLKPRRFEYRPLVYDPNKDTDEEEKHRIHFPRHHVLKKKSKTMFWLMVLLAIVLFIFWYLGGIQQRMAIKNLRIKNVEVVK